MKSALGELLDEPLDACLGSPQDCLDQARRIHDSYRRLDRRNIGAGNVLESKFAVLHWRQQLLSRFQDDPPPWLTSDHNTLAAIVDVMGIRLPDALLRRLSPALDRNTLHAILARQGMSPHGADAALDRRAGPGVDLDIRANRDSPWPFERWKRNPAFGRYEFDGDGVNFRGVHFRPGDVLLANVNIDGNGVYTVFSDPVRFSSHAAVFAILEDGGGRYPAVMETYEKGVRAVPLNVFLGEGFCAYVEVYRHRDLDETHAGRIGAAAVDLMRRARGYNFDSVSMDRDYVSCCTVGRILHEDAGLTPATPKSRINHPRARENLSQLGYMFFDFFAPVDYLLDDSFECVGWVDNAQFDDLLARELVEGYLRDLFTTRALDPRRFPVMARVNRWGIGQIRRQTLAGRVIGRFEGFDHGSLPRGPDPLMAVIVLVEAQLARAIRRLRRRLPGPAKEVGFSLAEYAGRPSVRAELAQVLSPPWLAPP